MSYTTLFKYLLTFGLFLFVAIICLFFLSGCGKKGNPIPIGPKSEATYPQTYPAPEE